MERAAFLVEETGAHIGCLLNPEDLVMSRVAGLRPRPGCGGNLVGAGIADDPLLVTGGGTTELTMRLLFDVELAGTTTVTDDVRELTRPLWALAEPVAGPVAARRPPVVRFVWGKAWNVRGVVAAVAERLERFTPGGAATRSWLHLRLVRVGETPTEEESAPQQTVSLHAMPDLATASAPGEELLYTVRGAGSGERTVAESLYEIATTQYGNPGMWRLIAAANGIADPLGLRPGTTLRIPRPPRGGTTS